MRDNLPRYTGAEDEQYPVARSLNKRNAKHLHWEQVGATWPDFLTLSANPANLPKNKFKAGGIVPALIRQTPSQSCPCERQLHKTKEAIVYRSLITMDADTADAGFAERAKATGWAAVLYTSASATKTRPKWRYVVRPSRATTPEEYAVVSAFVAWRVDKDRDDGKSSFDPAAMKAVQTMYLPAATKDPAVFERHVIDGALLDVDAALAAADLLELDAAPDAPEDLSYAPVATDEPATDADRARARKRLEKWAGELGEATENRNNLLLSHLTTLHRFVLGDCLTPEEVDDAMRAATLDGEGAPVDVTPEEYESVSRNAMRYAEKAGAARPHPPAVGPGALTKAEVDTRGVVTAQIDEAVRGTGEDWIELPPPSAPADVADVYFDRYVGEDGCITLRTWHGQCYEWKTTHWAHLTDDVLNANLYSFTKRAVFVTINEDGDIEERPWSPTDKKIRDLRQAIKATDWAMVLPSVTPGSRFKCADGENCALGKGERLISFTNGLVNAKAWETEPHTSQVFNLSSLPFAYEPEAPPPSVLLRVLKDYWDDDQNAIDAFQEQLGFLVFGSNEDLLKTVVIWVGVGDGGKSLMTDLVSELLGPGAVVGLAPAAFADKFGKEILIGAEVGVFSDAKFSGAGVGLAGVIKAISGWDPVNINRKGKTDWSNKVATRLLIVSNETPRLNDPSGTIAKRMRASRWVRSFSADEQDATLLDQLKDELTEIGAWALAGYRRALAQGYVSSAENADEIVSEIRAKASPMAEWLSQRVDVEAGSNSVVKTEDLMEDYNRWCSDNDFSEETALTARAFMSKLGAVNPSKPEERRLNGTKMRGFWAWRLNPVEDDADV